VLKEKPLLDDLETARDTTRRALERSLDEQVEGVTLCCGTLGRAACLLAMENVLRPDASLRQARDVASLLVRRYGAQARRDNEGWVDWPTAPKGSHPGLFQGYAGVGHFLLQLHDPSRVPSVLLPALSMG
jgi:lantibiotic modifying enzyme